MLQTLPKLRPECRVILNKKNLWGLDLDEFDYKIKMNTLLLNNESFKETILHSIFSFLIKSKRKNQSLLSSSTIHSSETGQNISQEKKRKIL
jgi:hypothetical protein